MKRSNLIALALLSAPLVALPVLSQAKSPAGSKPKVMAVVGPKIPAGIGGTWAVDPQHSRIGFTVRHLMINDIHGAFDDFEGNLVVNQADFTKSTVNFKAKIDSVDTHVPARDGHLKSPDFFDAAKYPELTFQSKRVMRSGTGFRVLGTFTMHGVSRDIIIPFTASGPVVDGFGLTRAAVKANIELNRQDYGVKWNQTLDNGGLAVSNVVRVELDLEAIKAGTGPKKPA